jgi:hypothetical protein
MYVCMYVMCDAASDACEKRVCKDGFAYIIHIQPQPGPDASAPNPLSRLILVETDALHDNGAFFVTHI